MFKVINKDTKQCKKHHSNLIDVVLVSLLLTLNKILTFFSSAVCEHVPFHLNMTTTIYVNTTVIMTMTATTTMIMTMVAIKTMIMTMIATMTKNVTTTMTKNITTSMPAIFKANSKRQFLLLAQK